jgi:TonB-linked SusC/RagA family outer membrane protein
MKKTLLLWLFGLLLTAQVYAQNRMLSGTVKDDKGEALIGVNVTGKGTTIGAVTDIDGKYTLELPKDVTTLVFSYIGYTDLEKMILSLKVDAVMVAEGQRIEEVVVTAGAIKREKRSTSYSTNTVNSEDLNKTGTNMFSALQAKTPGVRISTSNGAMGASNRIVLDGEASFLLGNNALLVVDGIPINNNTNASRTNDLQKNVDFGNRGNDFDPDNIESISVLKGPAATALYGSRGTSGVIIITTKTGKNLSKQDKKFNVSINSGVTFDKVYLQLKRQDKFGQGYNNNPDPIENFSWGPAFDGVIRPWTPVVVDPVTGISSRLIRPYSAVKNQLEDAFNLGITYRNGISFEGGNENSNYYFSYNNTTNKGVFDNTFYKRHAFSGNASIKLSKNLTSKINVQYARISQRALVGASFNTTAEDAPYTFLIQQPVNIPLNELRDYNSLYHGFSGYYGGYTSNPYYIMNNTNNDNNVNNLLVSAELEFKPVDYITLTTRVGDNFVLSDVTSENPVYNYFNPTKATNNFGIGSYSEEIQKSNNLTLDVIGAFSKEFAKNFKVDALGGFNYFGTSRRSVWGETNGGLTVPGFYNLRNSVGTATTGQDINNYRILGVYGQVGFSYKSLLFLEYTARNDWSSTLPTGKNGFFYQSGGVSFVPTELIKNNKLSDWISYVKIRFNAGTQGKDATPYLLESTYAVNPISNDGNLPRTFPMIGLDGNPVNAIATGNRIGNPNLKPELTIAYEAGVDLDILKRYVHLEYSFRHRTSKNLIIEASLPASSGFTTQVINVGKVRNVTNELLARVTVLKNVKGINWDLRYQFAKTNNLVLKANTDADEVNIGTYLNPAVVAVEGQPFGVIKVNDYLRDPEGKIVVDANGAPRVDPNTKPAGSFLPKYTMGWGSTLSIKGLTFDIQFDMKQGGVFYSGSKDQGDFNGTTLSSLTNNREPYIIPNSVFQNADGTFSENTTPITNLADIYGAVVSPPDITNIIDASYIKLREASISYNFDKKFFKNVPISSISIGVVGRNLKFWLPKENVYADPESNAFSQTGNEQGIEYTSAPSVRSLGFDFKIKF